ncbi:MAG: patatin-like phospholipase family protein [Deltaproteobacteria bacterium]|nr:patatin-like phospholipase family protein [Deltaproteobacteria bacterium]MBI3387110.1 patatin-like phospholipase family protein [Deltaproteobacteria bacterium]
MLGLVLTAGGARGAYQAGVLKRIGEIAALRHKPSPFRIVTGASAGAINGAMIAALSPNFREATQQLARLWSEVTVRDVFKADALSLGANGLRMLQDLTFGGLLPGAGVRSLLDASPLRAFLAKHLPLEGIAESIRRGHLYAAAVSATSYHSGKSFTFIEGTPGHPLWVKARRVTLAVRLTIDHICASAAIPIVFQPVRLRSEVGDFYFGDGGLRLVTPFSPAIRLGATRVFAVGIRCPRSADDLSQTELITRRDEEPKMPPPPLSQICGVFFNAIFLDHLDTDLDHLKRMNELVRRYGGGAVTSTQETDRPAMEPMRVVTPLAINPSEDLAIVAKALAHKMPRLVRYLMDGLGTPDAQSADLMSYLLFDSAYTRALIDIGYRDAAARIDEIEAFLLADAVGAVAPRPVSVLKPRTSRVASESSRPA